MPWPDFTELTFGFVFLREFEEAHVHGRRFPKAPDFISQGEEATKGYDVEVAMDAATPLFLQLKRSYVLVRSNAKEIQDGLYAAPRIYRMNLHKNGHYRQHKALQALEASGSAVLYVTSQIYTDREFARAYDRGTVVSDASALFSPSEIVLPDDTQDHHVSFRATDAYGYVYSNEPKHFERKFTSRDSWMSYITERKRSSDENREFLEGTVDRLQSDLSRRNPIRKMIAEKPIEQQASILSYFVLDSQLTFVK